MCRKVKLVAEGSQALLGWFVLLYYLYLYCFISIAWSNLNIRPAIVSSASYYTFCENNFVRPDIEELIMQRMRRFDQVMGSCSHRNKLTCDETTLNSVASNCYFVCATSDFRSL